MNYDALDGAQDRNVFFLQKIASYFTNWNWMKTFTTVQNKRCTLLTYHEESKVKAFVCCFLSNFYFFIKNYEKCFLYHWKSSFCSQDVQNFVIFSLPFQTFQVQKGKWKCNNLWWHELVCINLQMWFLE